jgi:hypothetical protein
MAHRLPCRDALYARAKGRNGWFAPKVVEFELSEHEDGTPLITVRLFSRRETALPPIELTVSVGAWEAQLQAIQQALGEERERERAPGPATL